ncbi:hypothetical protein T439DRAFT_320605 [Meredithblackwellia eburnea MCA 4105]
MGPPRRRVNTPPVLLAAAAATSLVGVLTWAWFAFTRPAPPPPENEESSSPRSSSAKPATGQQRGPKQGSKPSLTLACYALPPARVVNHLSDYFTVHLVFPGQPFDVSLLPYAYDPSFDRRRVLFHSTAEGQIHLTRVLGGLFVEVIPYAAEKLDCTPLPGTEETERIKLQQKLPDLFVKDVKTFVKAVYFVSSADETYPDEDTVVHETQGIRVNWVPGWDRLFQALGVPSTED